jgi:hypothetical protein
MARIVEAARSLWAAQSVRAWLGPNREAEQGLPTRLGSVGGTTMAAHRTGENEEDLLVDRQATLRALTLVRSQMGVLADHITGMEEQIRSVEENLVVLRQSHRKPA